MRLTGRGAVVGITGLVAIAVAALAGIQELYVIGAAAVALVVFSCAAIATRPTELESARVLVPAHLPAGDQAAVELTVTHPGARRSPVLSLVDPFDLGHGAAFRLASLGPGERLSEGYVLPPTPRGRYQVGPLRLVATDPFGLVRRTSLGAPASTLSVHPRITTLDTPPENHAGGRVGTDGVSLVGGGGDEFSTLRPYREGDDLRHVHWPSTARLEQLMVRQTDAASRAHAIVAVDLRAGLWNPAWLDEALSAAAGVLDVARRAGMDVRLVTIASDPGGWSDTGLGAGGAHWFRVLDALAAATPDAPSADAVPLASALGNLRGLRDLGGADTLTVITSSEASEGDLRAPAQFAGGGSLTVVVFGRTVIGDAAFGRSVVVSGRSAPPAGLAARVVHVAESGTFASRWEHHDRPVAQPAGWPVADA